MKKILFAILITFCLGMVRVNAASVSLSSSTNVVVGNTFTVTATVSSDTEGWDFSIGYDTSKLRLTESTLETSLHSASLASSHSRSYKLTFKAIASGSASIYVSDAMLIDSNGNTLSANKGSTKVNIKTQAEIIASYSKNYK